MWAPRHNLWHHPSARTPLYGRRRYSGFVTLKLLHGTIFEATWAQDKMGAPDYNAPSMWWWGGGQGVTPVRRVPGYSKRHASEANKHVSSMLLADRMRVGRVSLTLWCVPRYVDVQNIISCYSFIHLTLFLRFLSIYWHVKHDWCQNGPPNCSISLE